MIPTKNQNHTYDVNKPMISDAGDATATGPHRRYHCPRIIIGIVDFGCA